MEENSSAFFRFLNLPFLFIKREGLLARIVAISGFYKPLKSTQRDLSTKLKCRNDRSHILDYGCSNAEINEVLKNHTQCGTSDDFPKTLFLNYTSHRFFTFLRDEQPREYIDYYHFAKGGFYFCREDLVVKWAIVKEITYELDKKRSNTYSCDFHICF
jgi:hypothetical protein